MRVVHTAAGPRVVADQAAATPGTLRALLQLIRFDRPIGWLLLLWPTMLALWLAAGGVPAPLLLLVFGLGVFLTRSAGCIVNDYADRWLDPQVARTRARPLATGAIGTRAALAAFAGLMLLAFGLVLLTNRATVLWSLAALALTVLYPYCKRYTWYPQVVLGAAFSMGIPMAWSAHQLVPDGLAGLLFCTNLIWTVAYDTQYAMVDREDDRKAGAKSTALLFGELDRIAIGIMQGMALLGMLLVGTRAQLGWPYFVAVAGCAALFGLQQWWIRKRQPAACLQAFRNNNWVGLLWFAGAAGALWGKAA